jgi:hypothetical protein
MRGRPVVAAPSVGKTSYFCEGCGLQWRLRRIAVEPRIAGAPDVGSLLLCPNCVNGEDRAWRLRWRPTIQLRG